MKRLSAPSGCLQMTLSSVLDLFYEGKALQRDLKRLDWWPKPTVRFKAKWHILPLCHNNPMEWSRLEMTALQKSCPAEKNMRMPVNTQLNMSWQCVQVAKKTNAFLACIRYRWPAGSGLWSHSLTWHWWGCSSNPVSRSGPLTHRKMLRYWSESR